MEAAGFRASRLVQLPAELLHCVLSGLPGADRRALAATCFALRRCVVAATRALTVPGHDDTAVQSLVDALHLWPQLREVRIHASQHVSWSDLSRQGWAGRGGTVAVQLAARIATHCSQVEALEVPAVYASGVPALLIAGLGTCACLGQLRNLTSLALVKPSSGCDDWNARVPLLATPLRQLSALTSLRLCAAVDPASGGAWLPPTLLRLELSGLLQSRCPVGSSWLGAVRACTGLESLRLFNLAGPDIGLDHVAFWDYAQPRGEPKECDFYSTLSQLTALTELAGEFLREDYRNHHLEGDSSEDEYEIEHNDMYIPFSKRSVMVNAARLLSNGSLPNLRRLVLYAQIYMEDISSAICPALRGGWEDLTPIASTIEELAIWGPAPLDGKGSADDERSVDKARSEAAAVVHFPRLRVLCAATPSLAYYPKDWAAAFPALEAAFLGGSHGSRPLDPPQLPDLGPLAMLPRLKRLVLSGVDSGAFLQGPLADLVACEQLRELTLHRLTRPRRPLRGHEEWETHGERFPISDVAPVVHVPNLQKLFVDYDYWFHWVSWSEKGRRTAILKVAGRPLEIRSHSTSNVPLLPKP